MIINYISSRLRVDPGCVRVSVGRISGAGSVGKMDSPIGEWYIFPINRSGGAVTFNPPPIRAPVSSMMPLEELLKTLSAYCSRPKREVQGRQPMRLPIGLFCLSALLLTGCASIGPPTIARDRFDYDHAITMSWKRMMLLNLVKLRYGDTPMFLDVASIINSYT